VCKRVLGFGHANRKMLQPRLGVPGQTISASKMDSEPNYHKLSDQIGTLDMDNMAMIIRSIALSSKTIIAGKETPARLKVEELR